MNGRHLIWILCCVHLCCLLSCKEEKPVNYEIIRTVERRANNPLNHKMVDSSVAILHSGDIVVRTGNDITSYMLCQLNRFDKSYSHCGLVMVENGYPFVYHSIGGEDNPDEVLRRDSASFWFSPAHNVGYAIVRLDMPTEKHKDLFSVVRKFYKARKKFDMQFDIRTEDRFYCAEFVYKSVNQAMADSNYFKPMNFLGYSFMGIDNLFLNDHARIICQIRFK